MECCIKWMNKGNLKNPENELYCEIRFCPECGNQLKPLPICPYGKTLKEEIIACVKDCPDCEKRRFFTSTNKDY